MKRYIYAGRNGIYIIDLHQTVKLLDEAYKFVRELAANGGNLLFVGTKKQARESIAENAQRCGMFWVSERWLGGMLTNYRTIKQRIDRLKALRQMVEDGTVERLPKKERARLADEQAKLERVLSGIENMPGLPQALFVVDTMQERIAVAEARKLKIPVVAIVDTNCDPTEIDYVIPGNDDAIRSIKLITGKMADAVLEGKAEMEARLAREAAAAETVEASEETVLAGAEIPATAMAAAAVEAGVIAERPAEAEPAEGEEQAEAPAPEGGTLVVEDEEDIGGVELT